jgi:hypothetical protein
MVSFQECKAGTTYISNDLFTYVNKSIININRVKENNHAIISIDGPKASDKVQHPFILKKPGVEGMHLSIIKVTCDKLMVNAVLNG